MLKIQTK